MSRAVLFDPIAFDDIVGWGGDQLDGFLSAYRGSQNVLREDRPEWACALAGLADLPAATSCEDLRAEICRAFTPWLVRPDVEPGSIAAPAPHVAFTGYFEPELKASWTRTAEFSVPLYRRPTNLIDRIEATDRAADPTTFTHVLRASDGSLSAPPTRAAIETGALDGADLELCYLADPVDAFVLHVQGSGQLAFGDGSRLRVGYDGKNGHPYQSIGQEMIHRGLVPADQMTLDRMCEELRRSSPAERSALMQHNRSFIFFRELVGQDRPQGARGIGLHVERSLAVDVRFHVLGQPMFVSVPNVQPASEAPADVSGFQRLMVAHDVGSAIRGSVRGDIFFGSGASAGRRAGTVRHPGTLIALYPRGVDPRDVKEGSHV